MRFQSDPVFQMFPCLQPEARFKDIAPPRENNHRCFSNDDSRGTRDNGRSNDPPRQRERERDRERSRRSPDPPNLGKRSREENCRGDSNPQRRFSDDHDRRGKRAFVGNRDSHHENHLSAHDYLHTSLAEIDSLVQSRSTLASQEPVKPRGPYPRSSAAPPVPGRRVVSIPTPPPSRLLNYSRSR